MYEQVDEQGNQYNIFDFIIDHRRNDDAISKEDGYIISQNGVRRKIITTKGWELNVRWKDGSESWIPMNEINKSNPVEVAEYSISRKINNEPAFSWWVATILSKRNRIINKVKSRIKIKNLKYGIRIPLTLTEKYGDSFYTRRLYKCRCKRYENRV